MLKKSISLLLVFLLTFALAACGADETKDTSEINGAVSNTESIIPDDVADATSTEEGKKDGKTESTANGESKQSSTSSNSATASKNSVSINVGSGSKYNNSKTSSKSGTTSTVKVNQSTKKNITAAYKNIKVKSGKSVTEGLNFGGKTFTMAITEEGQYQTQSFKRCIAAFEKKYNCKITTKQLKFSTYNQQVSQALAGNKPYDICYAHGSMFPACAVDSLYNDLSDYITTSDLMNDDDPTAGGIDLAKTSYFYYNGKIVGTCNYSSCFPNVIYYNKAKLADAGYSGSRDPRKLAESGKWTWNTILSMGKKLTVASDGVYFLASSFCGRTIMLSYGAPIVTVNNGVYKENVTSAGYVSGLNLIRRMFVGNNAIAMPRGTQIAYSSYEGLLKGKVYMWTEETSKYLDLSKAVKTSSAFGRSKDNIGITSVPLGDTNKDKLYPTGWLTAVCSGRGSDPRVAIAWEVFRSSYDDPVIDSNAMSAEDQEWTDNMIKGGICCEVGQFANSSTSTIDLTQNDIIPKICDGADVSASVTSIKDQMTACIKFTLNKK